MHRNYKIAFQKARFLSDVWEQTPKKIVSCPLTKYSVTTGPVDVSLCVYIYVIIYISIYYFHNSLKYSFYIFFTFYS